MIKRKALKNLLKKIVKSTFFANLISSLVYWYARLVGATTRWEIHGREKCFATWDKDEAIILIGWHGRALMLPYFWNRYKRSGISASGRTFDCPPAAKIRPRHYRRFQ